MNKKVKVQHLGLVDYKNAWEYQEQLFQETITLKIKARREDKAVVTENHLLFVEHPHVFTLGKSGDSKNLLVNKADLEQNEAVFYKINRGGDITYHGPGQIVGYPILDLDNFFTDIHKYLRLLEEMVIRTLAEYGLSAGRSPGETGVWLGVETNNPRKICALGVRASRWVTMHGFAFNINTDMSYFDMMIPCGIEGKAVTSLNIELKAAKVNVDEVKAKLLKHFLELFDATLV